MSSRPPPAAIDAKGAGVSVRNALLQLPTDGPERRAVDAGEIDAIIDHVNGNVILFPAARRALRKTAAREATIKSCVANNLLAALADAENHRLPAGLELVTLKCGEVLHEFGVPFRYVYFPIDCVICLLSVVDRNRVLEVGLVGHEGMIGISMALGIDISSVRAMVQGPGTAMRMESTLFRQKILQRGAFREALYRYKHALVGQIAQLSACNQLHLLQSRIARHLLMTSDRARSSGFRLTHAFLADLLGRRRAGVTNAASALQKRMLIKYTRGYVTILDRPGLAAAACGCYNAVKSIHEIAGRFVLNRTGSPPFPSLRPVRDSGVA